MQREQKHNLGVLRHKWVILRFFCYNCHGPHYWGGQQGEVGIIDYKSFCPKIAGWHDYRNIMLDAKFMDVPEKEAKKY